MIDLRSDTVTKPTPEMLEAMMKAEVGDDVYKEDPTVKKLEKSASDLFGKEAALFMPSGVMANQVALKIHTKPGQEIILDADSHIFYYETGAPAVISGVMTKLIKSDYGMPPVDEIEDAIRPNIYYHPKTALICLENTHNRHGGTILDMEYLKQVRDMAEDHEIPMHLDGARIWNAHIETGIRLEHYAEHFETVSVCLSKGLGAPIGSLLIGDWKHINKARKVRKMLGGGMRQAGILAAAGLHAINNHIKYLREDNTKAKYFANQVMESPNIAVDLSRVQTNIVNFTLAPNINDHKFVELAKEKGLLCGAIGNNAIRVVFHMQISEEETKKAVKLVQETAEELAS